MSSNSEARKRAESREAMSEAEAHMVARCRERRRDVLQQALAAVYSGAGYVEADAVLDHLGDLGARLVVGPHE